MNIRHSALAIWILSVRGRGGKRKYHVVCLFINRIVSCFETERFGAKVASTPSEPDSFSVTFHGLPSSGGDVASSYAAHSGFPSIMQAAFADGAIEARCV